jgi:hypothetical protein
MARKAKSDTDLLGQKAQVVTLGIAIVNSEDWTVVFENPNFFKWFPFTGDAEEPLTERIPDFKPEKAEKRIEAGRSYSFETKATAGGPDLPIQVELRTLPEASEG